MSHFQAALKQYLNKHSFYSVDELIMFNPIEGFCLYMV